jgi:hypothetical protein
MMELFEDCGSRPIVFIRFNPDSYEADGKRYKGCFTLAEDTGLKVDAREFKRRMKEVVEAIERYRVNVPKKEVSVEQLFYNKV